jgi:antitoxin component of RelBE/YafQ-DinJ toxin-antitoxin module
MGNLRIYNVMTSRPKTNYVQFRIREDIKEELQIVAEMRGLTMSALIHSLIVKTIREEKEREPQAFRHKDVIVTVKKDSHGKMAPDNTPSKVRPKKKQG